MPIQQPTTPVRGGSLRPWIMFLIVGMGAAYVWTTRSIHTPDGWTSDYQTAVAKAQSTNRNLLLGFYMKGCAPCIAMNRTVLTQAKVRSAVKEFIPVHVDVDQQRELANRLGVFGTPTFAVVSPQGHLLARCAGFQPVESFLEFLTHASAQPLMVRPGVTAPLQGVGVAAAHDPPTVP